MKSNEHIKKFPPGEIPKCAKNQIWEAGDKNWSLGPASTGSMQKPGQPTNKIICRLKSRPITHWISSDARWLMITNY